MPKMQERVITANRTVVTMKQVFALSRGRAKAIISHRTSRHIYTYAKAVVIVPFPKYSMIPPRPSKTDEKI